MPQIVFSQKVTEAHDKWKDDELRVRQLEAELASAIKSMKESANHFGWALCPDDCKDGDQITFPIGSRFVILTAFSGDYNILNWTARYRP